MLETFKCGKNWQPCCTYLVTLLVVHCSKCFHSITHPQKHGFSNENNVSKPTKTHDMLETFKCGKNWQPYCTDLATMLVVHYSMCFHLIFHPRQYGFSLRNNVSKSIRTNHTSETLKYGKNWQTCCTNLATLLVVHYSKCFHSIRDPQKHGFSHENRVSKSIRTHDMLETLKCGKN